VVRALTSRWTILPLALAASLVWLAVLSIPEQRVQLSFLDVGQGDAILIQTPSRTVLVDGGPSPQAIARHLGRRLPFWDRELDLVVLTHPHADHLTGLLEVIERYRVKGVLATPYSQDSALYSQWMDRLREKGIPYVRAQRGQEVNLGGGGKLQVLFPGKALLSGTSSDANNNSVVLRLTIGRFSALLTGDLEAEGQRYLRGLGPLPHSLILKVPHQGAAGTLDPRFLKEVSPQVAVISVGADNPFGHPAAETLEELKGVQVLRTDQHGTIHIATDGERYWVTVEKKG
jgi:competence protein ComEC